MKGHRELGFSLLSTRLSLQHTLGDFRGQVTGSRLCIWLCHFRSGHHVSFSKLSSEIIAQWIPPPSPCWQLSRPRLGRSPSGAQGSQGCLSSWLPKVPSHPREGSHHSGPEEPGKRPACPQRLVLPVVLLSQAGLTINTCD